MKYILLSETELDIMQLLWEENSGLSRPEILSRLEGKDWNPNSIHQVLNSMMKKGVLQVDGMARCGKIYGRTYMPTMTQQEFLARRTQEITPGLTTKERILGVVAALADQEGLDAETIQELEQLLEAHKKGLTK
jgi:predicted transcriptional regulator